MKKQNKANPFLIGLTESDIRKNFELSLNILYAEGYRDLDIANMIELSSTYFSRIKNDTVKINIKVLNRLNKIVDDLNLVKEDIQYKMSSAICEEDTDLEIGGDAAIFLHKRKLEIEIRILKEVHKKERDQLNSIIDHLRFIISQYKNIEKEKNE